MRLSSRFTQAGNNEVHANPTHLPTPPPHSTFSPSLDDFSGLPAHNFSLNFLWYFHIHNFDCIISGEKWETQVFSSCLFYFISVLDFLPYTLSPLCTHNYTHTHAYIYIYTSKNTHEYTNIYTCGLIARNSRPILYKTPCVNFPTATVKCITNRGSLVV